MTRRITAAVVASMGIASFAWQFRAHGDEGVGGGTLRGPRNYAVLEDGQRFEPLAARLALPPAWTPAMDRNAVVRLPVRASVTQWKRREA